MNNQIIVQTYNGNGVRIVMIDGDPWFTAKDVAEILGYGQTANIGRNILIRILIATGVLDKHNVAYQKYVRNGYFKVVASNPNNIGIKKTTLVTPRGLDYIRNKIISMTEFELIRASGSARVISPRGGNEVRGQKAYASLEKQSEINLKSTKEKT